MWKILMQEAEKYAKQNHRRRIWRKFVRVMACVVVFCTTYALILPAITMEKNPCDLEEHTHSESCYEKVVSDTGTILACTYETLGVHVHTSDCYDGEKRLICGQADYLIHEHNDDCLDENGAIVCQLPEVSTHVHTDDCYRIVGTEPVATESVHTHGDDCYGTEWGELICQVAETEGHSHGENCFTLGELVCQLTEQEGHTHGADCYEWLLTCELSEEPAHQHTDECYEMVSVLICELEEGVTTTATTETQEVAEPERELICTEPAAQVHIHSEECFATEDAGEDTLTCTLPEDENHTHSTICYGTWELICGKEEHTHGLVCRNDPEADVETEADWMATFADVTLTGEWDADLLSIARSQLGYQESTRNYEVMEDGETIKGYTRYGDWYGMPYGDWCAMFVSFCLNYAEIPQDSIPYEANCPGWIEALQNPDYDLYQPAGEYTPVPGDLIFFDWEEDGTADHVGIVAEVIPATEEEPAKIKTIEGNVGDQVVELEYDLDDSTILGYGQLPEKPLVYCCGIQEHSHDASCVDENGGLICGLDEHIHTSDCGALTDEEWAQVQQVIALIDEMPSSEEIDAKLMEYEDAGDLAGQDVYFEEVWTQVCEIYDQYALLSDKQKACVTNADKLLALEYMWANQEDASDYAPDKAWAVAAKEISGYNMNANNIYPIDAFLGPQAGYTGASLGASTGGTKGILSKYNVICIKLPKVNGSRLNLGTYLMGSGWTIEEGKAKGNFGVKLYDDWCAVRVEYKGGYPGYELTQVVCDDNNVQRIGNLSYTNDNSFLLMIRKSYIKNNNKYMWVTDVNNTVIDEGHLNIENLKGPYDKTDLNTEQGWLPSDWSANNNPKIGYFVVTPKSRYDANDVMVNGDPGARDDDMKVVDNIKFKLFDYSNFINKIDRTSVDSEDEGTIHAKYRALAQYFYFRGGFIDEGRDYSLDVAKYTPNVNTASQDGSGHSIYDQDGYTVNHARVEPNLWNGYPILDFTVDAKGNAITPPTDKYENVWTTGKMLQARSLRFLFDQNHAETNNWSDLHKVATDAVTEYSPTNTILQFDEDTYTYWYDSAKHAVDYDIDAKEFRVRAYTERTSITADWPFGKSVGSGDFLPFNYTDGIVNATYHSGEGFADYEVTDSAIRMNDVNYWFGMTMEFTFIQGEDGTVTYTDSNGVKHTDVMEFKFSGDDDVWVFIDGVRILDLGGTHGSVTGSINFQTGKVVQKKTWEENSNKSFPTTLQKCFTLAGKTPKGGWDSDGDGTPSARFADYSVHTLKFYYLERGTAVANCSIEFNLPNFDTPLVVGKTLSAANEDVDPEVLGYLQDTQEYSYRVLVADENGNVLKDANGNPILFMRKGQEYTLVDHANPQRIGTKLTVGENGIFKVKHGQQAVFEDILTIAKTIATADGKEVDDYKYFVVEEILPNNQTGHYNKIEYKLDTDPGWMMGNEGDSLEDFLGYYTPAISVGEPQHVQYNNTVDTDTLSVLKVTKAVTEASEFAEDQEFNVNVKLDGEYLAADTKYSIDGTEYTVGENGAVTLKAGQTAEILVPVLAGTTFEVVEAAQKSWVVTYQSVTTDKDGSETIASGNSGSFPMDGIVHVTVTNSTYRYRVPLTFTKKAEGNDSTTTEFTFEITQVDGNGNALTTPVDGIGWPQNPTITPNKNELTSEEIAFTFGSSVVDGTYYFRLTEQDMDGWLKDPSVYLIAIEIADGTAKLSSVTKDGTDYGTDNSLAFVNYRKLSFTVDKTVTGNYTEAELQKPFSFTAVVMLDGKQVIPEEGNGYTVAEDGTVSFTLTHDQSVTINGIPYGATVTVTEADAPGYTTHYTLNTSAQKHSSTSAEVSGVTENNTIYFVNTGGYELPNAGGTGTTTYTMAGLVLICFSMAYLMYRPKARRREEFESP